MRRKISVIGFFLVVMSLLMTSVYAQNREVRGEVVDNQQRPLGDVTVIVKGTNILATTRPDGTFTLTVGPKGTELVFSAVGYESRTLPISANLRVTLNKSSSDLDSVVVVAYGTQKKQSLTGSIATISSKDIQTQQVTSVGNVLQGLAAGVSVITTTGQPGENPTIRIRGVGSINASADPLWVVDGVPFYGNINNISPNDIESMSVLKDATATALYGSRAANGVILVTTRKGTKGTPQINVYGSYGWSSRAVKEYKFLDVKDYMELAWEAVRNFAVDNDLSDDAAATYATNNLISRYLKYNPYDVPNPIGTDGKLVDGANQLWSTNWTKALEQHPNARKNVGINISGASDAFRYFLSTDYLDQNGYVLKSDFKRVATRFNGDATLRPWLNLGLNLSITDSKQNYPTQEGSAYASAIGFARGISSIYPIYVRTGDGRSDSLDADGNKIYDMGYGRPSGAAQGINTVASRNLDSYDVERLAASINSYAQIKFTDWLNFKSTIGVDRFVTSTKEYDNPLYGDAANISGRYVAGRNQNTTYTWNNMLSFQKAFGDHNLGAMASYEAFDYKNEILDIGKTGFPYPGFSDVAAGSNYESGESPTYEERLVSYLGRLTYNFKNKYFIEGTVRRDGSSRFADGRRWGTFYSVGGAWDLAKEDFISSIGWLDQLKLRGSYGEVGNNSLTSYFPYMTLYSTGYNDLTNAGVYLSQIVDSKITWEKLGTWDLGLDYSVLNGRLSGSVDYYNKNTFDLLGSLVLPPSSGFTSITTNIGKIRNSGFEFVINSQNIVSHDFKWSTSFNLATLRNRIISQSQASTISGSFRYAPGLPMYNYYVAKWAGVNSETGAPQWLADVQDADGNVTGTKIVNTYSEATRYDMGSALAKVTGGINNRFTYKNIDFSFLINYSFGGKILDQDYIGLMSGMISTGAQQSVDLLNRWQKPGDVTDVPRLSVGQTDYGNASTRQLVSGNYARLRNFTLGYTLPSNLGKLDNVVKSARIYIMGDNMLTWKKAKFDGLDPEVALNGLTSNSSTPFKTITVGLNVGF